MVKREFQQKNAIRQLSRALSPLDGSDTLRRFLKLMSWTMVAFALDKSAMLAIVFLLARILGAEDYGRLTLAQGLVNSVQIFVLLGAGSMLARYVPVMREQGIARSVEVINLCALVVLGTLTVFSLAGLAGAPVVAVSVLELSAGSMLPYWIIGWVALIVVNNLVLTVMLSFERGRAMGLISLAGAGLSVAIVPFLSMRTGLEGAVIGLVAAEAGKAVLLLGLYGHFLKKQGVSILTPPRRSDVPLLFSFGLPVFLQSALWAPTLWLAQFILKSISPDGLVAVAVFGVTNNILGAVLLMSGLSNRAALPILSSLQARGEYEQLTRMTLWTFAAQTGMAFAIGIPLAIASPFIMAGFGDEFREYWPVLLVMIAAAIVISGQTALGNFLLVNEKAYFLLLSTIPGSAAILASPILLKGIGVYSLAFGLLLSSVIRTSFFGYKFRAIQNAFKSEAL